MATLSFRNYFRNSQSLTINGHEKCILIGNKSKSIISITKTGPWICALCKANPKLSKHLCRTWTSSEYWSLVTGRFCGILDLGASESITFLVCFEKVTVWLTAFTVQQYHKATCGPYKSICAHVAWRSTRPLEAVLHQYLYADCESKSYCIKLKKNPKWKA